MRSKSTVDDAMDVNVTHISLSTTCPHAANGSPSGSRNTPLSTLRSVLEENAFLISVDDVSRFKLPPAPSSSHTHSPPSTLVLLSAHDTSIIGNDAALAPSQSSGLRSTYPQSPIEYIPHLPISTCREESLSTSTLRTMAQ